MIVMLRPRRLPIATENSPAPLPISPSSPQRHITTDPLDPSTATTYAEFIRAMRQVANDKVNAVYSRHRVNVNVRRDEKRHEVATSFQETLRGPGDSHSQYDVRRTVDGEAFGRWSASYWSEVNSDQ